MTEAITQWIQMEEALIAKHLKDLDERYAEADRWLTIHRHTLRRLKLLQARLLDPAVPDSMLIQLPAPESET